MELRQEIFNKLPIFSQNYIKSIVSNNNLSELDTQLGVNFIHILSNTYGISTEIIDLNNYSDYALPIIVHNSTEWRKTFPDNFKTLY